MVISCCQPIDRGNRGHLNHIGKVPLNRAEIEHPADKDKKPPTDVHMPRDIQGIGYDQGLPRGLSPSLIFHIFSRNIITYQGYLCRWFYETIYWAFSAFFISDTASGSGVLSTILYVSANSMICFSYPFGLFFTNMTKNSLAISSIPRFFKLKPAL